MIKAIVTVFPGRLEEFESSKHRSSGGIQRLFVYLVELASLSRQKIISLTYFRLPIRAVAVIGRRADGWVRARANGLRDQPSLSL